MTGPASFRVWLLASSAWLPLAAHAQSAAAPDAVHVLLDQASYWRGQNQADKADQSLARALSIDPSNADALAAQAQAALDAGQDGAARAATAKLQAAHPDDPRLAALQDAVRAGTPDPAAVSRARSLAQAGKAAEAVAAYRHLFQGDTPPPGLATEYYQTLAATDAGRTPAEAGFAAMLRANPGDLRSQLAYAQILTYRESTRSRGISRLQALAGQPQLRDGARDAWRQALVWSGDNQQTLDAIDAYLKRFPDDAEMTGRRAAVVASLPDANARLRMAGYQALDGHRTAAAEQAFITALAANPDDVDALAMLAIIRRQQGRPEWRHLLDRAIELAPDRRDELIASTGANKGAAGDGGAAIRRAYAHINELTKQGQYAAAEAALRTVLGHKPTTGGLVQLGYIQLQAGELAQAQASFQQAEANQPRSNAARNGLAAVLARQGDIAGARTLYAAAGNTAALNALDQPQGSQLRDAAHDATDPEQKIRLYQEAIAASPNDPWLRLEFARVLLADGYADEAQEVMAPVAQAPHPTTDQARAALYYADGSHDYAMAISLAARLPQSARTPEIVATAARARVALDLEEVHDEPDAVARRTRMLELAAVPDPAGTRGVAFAEDLIRTGDKAGAREVIRAALNSGEAITPPQRIAYAGMLVAAGYPLDAQIVTAALEPATLDPLQRSTFEALQNSAAVEAADMLTDRGQPTQAYGQLAPRLAQDPANPDLKMALARVYEQRKQPQTALHLNEDLLQAHPDDLTVRVATISAALAAGETGRAQALAREARQRFPDEPQAWLASAQVDRAERDDGDALADLRTARSLRAKQLGSEGAATGLEGQLRQARYAFYQAPDTASDAATSNVPDPNAEPVTREYERYAENAPQLQPGATPPQPSPAPAPDLVAPPANLFMPPAGSRSIQVQQGGIPAALPDEPNGPPGIPTLRSEVRAQPPPDPIMAEIDRSMDQVSSDIAPSAEASIALRGRSGPSGLASLYDVTMPLEADYSPLGYGRLKLVVTPEYLNAGGASGTNLQQFGTNPLLLPGSLLQRGQQSATGVALDVGYSYKYAKADIGTTPLGFTLTNVVGGLEVAPQVADGVNLRATLDRRAVTDSLLAYGGERDPRTGQTWGGVMRDRAHLQVDGQIGDTTYYAGGGGALLTGQNVKDNAEWDLGTGFSVPVWKTATQEIRAGLDLVYFSFYRNLQAFTLGSGGYFSPQSFFAGLIPVSYREHLTPDLVYGVGGSIGVQSFHENAAPVFTNAGLESQLQSLAATQPGLATSIPASHSTGVAGGASADVDYRVVDNLHIGAKVGFDRAGNFTEGTGLVYARYVFHEAP